jgi:hypothetical protein
MQDDNEKLLTKFLRPFFGAHYLEGILNVFIKLFKVNALP